MVSATGTGEELLWIGHGQRQGLMLKRGPDRFQAVMDEAQSILEAGGDHTFDAGERRGAPLGAMDASVAACRRQAANIAFAPVVIRRHLRVIEEREQLAAVLEQAVPDPQALGMTAAASQQQIVEAIEDLPMRLVEGCRSQLRPVFAQLDRVLEQRHERLDEGPDRGRGKFLPQLGQFPQQMHQAALLGTFQAVVGRIEIADQRASERFPQNADDDFAVAMPVDQEQRQRRVAEAPHPGGLAVDSPAGFVRLDDRRVSQFLEQLFDDRLEQRPAPSQMAEQPGATDRQAEEVVQQIPRLPQRNAQMGAAVAGEQTRPRSDVRSRQFQIAASLTRLAAVATFHDMPSKAMPFQLRFRDVGDDVIFELASRLEIVAAAVLTRRRMHVMLDEGGIRRRLRTKGARMPPMFLEPAVSRRPLPRRPLSRRALPPLQDRLQLMLQLRDPPPQFGVLRLQFGNSSIARVIHDSRNLNQNAKLGKSKLLNSYTGAMSVAVSPNRNR